MLMNSKKLFRKSFEYSESWDTENFQHWNCDPEEEHRDPGPYPVFFERQRFHTHIQ